MTTHATPQLFTVNVDKCRLEAAADRPIGIVSILLDDGDDTAVIALDQDELLEFAAWLIEHASMDDDHVAAVAGAVRGPKAPPTPAPAPLGPPGTTAPAKTACPSCGYEVDRVTRAFGVLGPPTPMVDITVCIECEAINAYNEAGELVAHPNADELANDPEIVAVRESIRTVRARLGDPLPDKGDAGKSAIGAETKAMLERLAERLSLAVPAESPAEEPDGHMVVVDDDRARQGTEVVVRRLRGVRTGRLRLKAELHMTTAEARSVVAYLLASANWPTAMATVNEWSEILEAVWSHVAEHLPEDDEGEGLDGELVE